MNFLLLVILLVLQRHFDLPFSRVFDRKFAQLLGRRQLDSVRSVYLYVGVLGAVCLLIFGLMEAVRHQFFGLLYFFFEFLLLIFLLGDSGFKEQLAQFVRSNEKADFTGAHYILAACYPTEAVYQVNSPASLRVQACHWLIGESFRRYFLVIFWFVIFGAPAALFVRLLEQSSLHGKGDNQRRLLRKFYEIVSFLPSRFLAFSFALTGNFPACVRVALVRIFDFSVASAEFLLAAAQGAIDVFTVGKTQKADTSFSQGEQTVQTVAALRELLSRSLGVWFMVLALLALAGWM